MGKVYGLSHCSLVQSEGLVIGLSGVPTHRKGNYDLSLVHLPSNGLRTDLGWRVFICT